ncbi:VOC family protein [Pseudoalteromonas sp.]|uniref:VOC family protein n=1 Tax=Pseudoalteromonas sp. TaxID=53249 RepID=UPI00258115D4|nr:VOC family protein [Pseudoalteromonas sp.]
MSNMAIPSLRGVDHCHLNVDDLAAALKWYQQVLGFNVVPELAFWDEGKGPLTLEDQAKTIRLALFEADGRSKGIAFGANAAQFLAWLEHLAQFDIKTFVADHGVTYSMYFKDCAGNSHEITSHDYGAIKKGLK